MASSDEEIPAGIKAHRSRCGKGPVCDCKLCWPVGPGKTPVKKDKKEG